MKYIKWESSLTFQIPLGWRWFLSLGLGLCVSAVYAAPRTNIAESTLTSEGWTQCWSQPFNQKGTPISTVLSNCRGSELLMGCRPIGESTFTVVADAPRADVIYDTGDDLSTTHSANGTEWYFNKNRSWGFANGGDSVNKNTCDTAAAAVDKRMCIHTRTNNIHSGWRCGVTASLNGKSNWESVLFHREDQCAELEAGPDVLNRTVPVNMERFLDYCADESGCRVTLGKKDVNAVSNDWVNLLDPATLVYNKATKRWNVGSPINGNGTDADGVAQHIMGSYPCYFIDGEYTCGDEACNAGSVIKTDDKAQIGLVNWSGGPNTTCVLVIRDDINDLSDKTCE
ncbi:MAG: hypothetical protein DRR16_32260 [Candidatus Parabeggiatoa sp. nov. 3]|nr:MAG: hypothetical protein DRR00_33635 [Gammaproteobacteria bacterium]RKZ74286.1 MAG: hypothetical protein DRR16_32260 [Gammaproteobacteria bacterium]